MKLMKIEKVLIFYVLLVIALLTSITYVPNEWWDKIDNFGATEEQTIARLTKEYDPYKDENYRMVLTSHHVGQGRYISFNVTDSLLTNIVVRLKKDNVLLKEGIVVWRKIK